MSQPAPASNGFTCPAAGAAPRQCLEAMLAITYVTSNKQPLMTSGVSAATQMTCYRVVRHITYADRPDITIGAGASAQVSPRYNPF